MSVEQIDSSSVDQSTSLTSIGPRRVPRASDFGPIFALAVLLFLGLFEYATPNATALGNAIGAVIALPLAIYAILATKEILDRKR